MTKVSMVFLILYGVVAMIAFMVLVWQSVGVPIALKVMATAVIGMLVSVLIGTFYNPK
jgi:hypothetical protein